MPIQFTDEQLAALRRIGEEQRVSIAHAVRQAVDEYVSKTESSKRNRRERVMALSGKFSSGKSDVARNHDKYLEEAFGSWSS